MEFKRVLPSNWSAATKQVKVNTRERQRCKPNCSSVEMGGVFPIKLHFLPIFMEVKKLVPPIVVTVTLQKYSHFPLNHDHGRKSKPLQTLKSSYLFLTIQFYKKNLLGCSNSTGAEIHLLSEKDWIAKALPRPWRQRAPKQQKKKWTPDPRWKDLVSSFHVPSQDASHHHYANVRGSSIPIQNSLEATWCFRKYVAWKHASSLLEKTICYKDNLIANQHEKASFLLQDCIALQCKNCRIQYKNDRKNRDAIATSTDGSTGSDLPEEWLGATIKCHGHSSTG